MVRVRNLHSAPVDHVAPGEEGELCDSASLRSLVAAGLLEVVADAPLAAVEAAEEEAPRALAPTMPPPPPPPPPPAPTKRKR